MIITKLNDDKYCWKTHRIEGTINNPLAINQKVYNLSMHKLEFHINVIPPIIKDLSKEDIDTLILRERSNLMFNNLDGNVNGLLSLIDICLTNLKVWIIR